MKKVSLAVLATVGLVGIGVIGLSVETHASELYRLYNPNTGQHHYTLDGNERNFLKKKGWNYEGVAWVTPDNGASVYRLYNPNNGDHHYTTATTERDMLRKVGWNFEGLSYKSGGKIPVYRLYNPNAKVGYHHYTINATERDMLKKAGWRYEGIGFYAQSIGQNSKPNSGGIPAEFIETTTVWFEASRGQTTKYNINRGTKIFSTEAEAMRWIDNYADNVKVSGSWGTQSWW